MHPKEQLITTGEAYYQSLLADIHEAQHSIDFEVYMFNDDAVGQQCIQALVQAHQRGVTVRVMVDGVGSPRWHSCAKRLDQAGIPNKIYHPYPWQWWHWKRSGLKHSWFSVRWARLLTRINRRDHRKMVVIDQRIAFIGSFNVSRCHLSMQAGGLGWCDTAVRLCDEDLHPLKEAFELSWEQHNLTERMHDALRRVKNQPRFRLNNTLQRRLALHHDLLKRIRHAQTRINITNAYFLPNNRLLRHLTEASMRGVKVSMILPRKMDVSLSRWAAVSFYRKLIQSGIQLYDYLPSMLHAKTLIIDDWMMVGSSNMNHRSLLHDLEVNAVLQSPETKADLVQQFKAIQAKSQRIMQDYWEQHTWYQRLWGRFILYFKYML